MSDNSDSVDISLQSDDIRRRERRRRRQGPLWGFLSVAAHVAFFAVIIFCTPVKDLVFEEKEMPPPNPAEDLSADRLEDLSDRLEEAHRNELLEELEEMQAVLHNMEMMKQELLEDYDDFAEENSRTMKDELEKLLDEAEKAQRKAVEEQPKVEQKVEELVREEQQNEKFKTANANLKSGALSAMNIIIITMPLMTFFMNFTSLSVLWFGGRMVLLGGMKLGDLTAFTTYITQILMSLMMLSMVFMTGSRAAASAKRLGEVLDEKVDITDVYAKEKDRKVSEGRIEFKNVDFRYYENSEEKVLNNINLTIEPGKVVGIIGSTGCGKTTLVSMIPRLYDVDAGEVLVDGVNVKDYSLYNLREAVGMVLQKNVLFSGSIRKNLRWGKEDATDEEIIEACKSAQADDFIQNFTEGYERELGQGGVNVSGGQKQRLCIARALLKHPKILILDDSTSAVDTATEAKIREAFAKELKDATKIIIAQRISSVKDADEIVVMDDGKITGGGTHEELLKTNEIYSDVFESQQGGSGDFDEL